MSSLNKEMDILMRVQRQGYSMRNMLTTLKKLDLFDMTNYHFQRMDDQEWASMGAPDAGYLMRITYRVEKETIIYTRCM